MPELNSSGSNSQSKSLGIVWRLQGFVSKSLQKKKKKKSRILFAIPRYLVKNMSGVHIVSVGFWVTVPVIAEGCWV